MGGNAVYLTRNKKCIFNLAKKNFGKSKTRNIITILAIILTTMLFTSMLTICTGTYQSIQTTMEMQQVTFSYYGSTKPDVENVSMMLKKGEKIAFVGSSGSGKTTITKLLLNVFSHYQGQILVNGEDIKQICKEDIDRIFAIVTQVPMAMNGTIRENVDITNTLTDEEIYHYLDLVELKDDIEKFPLGLNTFVGENGQNISGGQKQRIAIARALALKPEVIIFDEATSNLDPLTERRICNNLKQLHITQIVVTHRLNAIQDADTIYVVEKGKIIESGTHVELLQLKGAYYDSVNN